ncbi:inositol 1,4,5-triphosphate receptor associated 1-like isoform X1 [Amphibalanus amphitrite]|uniref:inositol 1,4,5-triphosphate receptor associated 1-like isoform X1 n=1 Tax=Amphibalanus amphitrite TaxID=1232801 RepID=UPI001C906F41|nr:inositol 1,4,5-triphosphate receptor associated 1-like isoform X1 [Amphibalanus amphitrite]
MRRSISEVWPVGLSGPVPPRSSSLRRSLSEVAECVTPCGDDTDAPTSLLPGGGDDGDDARDLVRLTAASDGPSATEAAEKLVHLYQVVERVTNKCYVSDRNANNTAEKDLENKFSSLALAFKTDRLTLQERLDVQRRHRDQAEHNLELETQRFRDQLMQQLSQADEDRPAHLKSLQRQVEIFKQISQRLSSTAEVLGAVQQELRVSHAVEVMTQHVENLRHLYDREHAELEEARRVLASHKLALQEPGATKAGPPGRRRASIAVFAAGRGSPSNGEARPPTVAPPSGSPTNQLMLKRRRNSADGKSFDSITEEKEEEREHDDTGTKPETASDELYRPDEDELRSHVESAVSDELASLRSEQEQLANDLRTLLSRQTGAVVEQTSIAGRVVWDLVRAWPYSREETAHHLRFCCGGLFLVLAVLVLLVPPAFGLRGHQRDV